MHLIVDGYNVLFAIARYGGGRPISEVIDEARERLLPELVRYAQETGDQVTVVFDSRQPAGGATRAESLPGVTVRYSHPPRTADDDILALVERSTGAGHIEVVTSDRELAGACRRAGAEVTGAKSFYGRLQGLLREAEADQHEQQIKREPPSDAEVRHWLEIFGDDEPHE